MIFPSLNISKEECEGGLRRLELETYSNIISVFRAQGVLNNEKIKLLEQMRNLLFITEERHRAEARRAANDEFLSTIANTIYGPNSELQWLKEGKRKFPLINRQPPLTSLTNVANSAVKFAIKRRQQENLKKLEEEKKAAEKKAAEEKELKNVNNLLVKEIENIKNTEETNETQSSSNKISNTGDIQHAPSPSEIKPINSNIISAGELKLDIHKFERSQESNKDNKTHSENSNSIVNQVEVEPASVTSNIIEKGKFIILNNEIVKPVTTNSISNQQNLIGNILNIKRKPVEKMTDVTEVVQSKIKKTIDQSNQEQLGSSEIKTVSLQKLEDNSSTMTTKSIINTNQSSVSVQKININPFVIENATKVPSNTIQIKDLQNRKPVKLITAPNGKIFIQPAQGNSRVTNIRPITTMIKPNQCIALKKVTSLAPVSSATDIQSKPIKISKANMIILPKTSINQKGDNETSNLSKFSLQTSVGQTTTTSSSPIIPIASTSNLLNKPINNDSTTSTTAIQNQGNVFVIGSVINQNLHKIDKHKDIGSSTNDVDIIDVDNNDSNINDTVKNLITEDTPVDIIQSPIEEMFKSSTSSENVKIIAAQTASVSINPIPVIQSGVARHQQQQQLKNNFKIMSTQKVSPQKTQENILTVTKTSSQSQQPLQQNIYSTTDWELELDQEVAAQQRNKERSNNSVDDENFNSVIEEIVEEATEDSFSDDYEDTCQYDETSSS